MAVAFSGANYAAASSITLPAHAAGDLIVILAYNQVSSPATVPTGNGYASIVSSADVNQFLANGMSVVAGYKIATSSSEVSGTWTGASKLIALVYSGADIGASTSGFLAGTSFTIPSLTLNVTGGTSWVLVGLGLGTADADALTILSLTRRKEDSGSTPALAAFDTNGGVSSFAGGSDTGYTTTNSGVALVIEIKAAASAKPWLYRSHTTTLGAGFGRAA